MARHDFPSLGVEQLEGRQAPATLVGATKVTYQDADGDSVVVALSRPVLNNGNANAVFSFGRDHGHYGRILNVTVVALPTLRVRNKTEIVGYCFTPQDGNSLLSSVSAATWFLHPDDYEERIQCLKPYFYAEV